MPITVTLCVFSGRPNPRFQLAAEEEQELLRLLRRLRVRDSRRVSDVRPTGFGIIRVTRGGSSQFLCGGGLIEFPLQPSLRDDPGIENWLIGLCPRPLLPSKLKRVLIDYIKVKEKARALPLKKRPPCKPNPAADSPVFDEFWAAGGWNGNPLSYNHQFCNNCYDYANNQQTDTFSQPGYGGGQIFSKYTISNIAAASALDGLVKVANPTSPLALGKGWYVALLIGRVGDSHDFHWVRQDQSGCWSHKLGSGSVWDTDSNFKANH